MNDFAPVLPPGLEQGHGAAEVAPRRAHVVEKCTFCSHRVDQGLQPACVEACPTQVITFGDLEDPHSAVAREREKPDAFRINEQSGADPSVWFLPARAGAKQRRS
jgi:dimethyl sulfoxide reductase iron-sulfur subunit